MRRKILRAFVALATTAAGLALLPGAATAAPPSGIRPVRPCAELVGDIALPAATTHVTSATVVPAAGGAPEYCDVRGFVEPAVNFQLRLPTTTYTGRYLQYGCGGFCGEIVPPAFPSCGGPRPGDMAVAATDDGHTGSGPFAPIDGRWGAGNRQARDDWQFRAPHVLSRAAKRIIATFYGSPPRRAYFSGCSNGGREALLLAQRYPDDFDGIVAAAPATYIGPLAGVYETWLVRSNTAADGSPILTPEKLPVLHTAVLAACDRLDGLVDGQIDDPRRCRFNPGRVACPAATDQPTCLTRAQVAAARKLYAGPTDRRGHRLYPGGQSRGSELAWFPWLIPIPEFGGSIGGLLADNYLRYLGYPIGRPHSSVAEFRFTVREFDRLTPEGIRANAMSLDLSRFRRHGGKLIIWHGWDDQAIPAVGTLDYYQRLFERAGGLRATQRWARLFMIPTMYHCDGGYKLTSFDAFPALVGWVEHGRAPDRIVAEGRDEQGTLVRTRPVFPYPVQAKYDGSGSVDDAANFVPRAPAGRPHDVIRWVGEDLFGRPGPVAP